MLKEHRHVLSYDWCREIVPDWIHKVNSKGNIKRGPTKKHIDDIINDFTFHNSSKEEEKRKAYQKYNELNK